jgi:asparagine N-glycosylation enzyme membrane subunit Stt3
MNASSIYVIISLVVLAVIASIVFFVGKKKEKKRFTVLAGIAFTFILAGINSGEQRIWGYSFIGIGLVFAIIDIVLKLRREN